VNIPQPLTPQADPRSSFRSERPEAVNVLRWQDECAAAAVLAGAFVDDPLVMAICPGPPVERQRRIGWSFRVAVRGHCLARQPGWTIVDADGPPVAVVLAIRPHPGPQSNSDLLFAMRSLLRVGLGVAIRGSRAAQIIAAHAPAQPFTYLRTLGVDPPWQGRGFGSRLVEWVIQSAPAAFPIYLETAKEANLAFYERHGFSCKGQFSCLGVRVWRLLRPAADGSVV